MGTKQVDTGPDKQLYYRLYDALSQKKEPGIGIGMPGLESFYLEPNYIHVVAAESGTGKSAFLLQASDYVARNYGPVLYLSLESTDLKLAARRLASTSKIALTRINKQNIQSDWEWEKIVQCCDELSTVPLRIVDFNRFYIENIVSYCESACIDNDIRLIVIDFLQLIYSRKKHSSRHLEISYIIQQFKMLAKELNVPVLYACQLSRKDYGNRPTKDRLKESGDIETHTDNIIFLWSRKQDREVVYPVECFLAKGKDQEPFDQWLEFNGNYQEFTEGIPPNEVMSRRPVGI